MRIFFITNNYTPYSGGVVHSINAAAEALQIKGHEVYIITLQFLSNHHDDPYYVIRIPSFLRFTYKKNHMALPWRMYYHLEKCIKEYKPDIIHIHHPFLLGKVAVQLAKQYKIPCIFTYHTLYEEYAHYVPLPLFVTKMIMHSMIGNFCNQVNAIIAPSMAIKQYILNQNINTPIIVIPSPLRNCFTNYALNNSNVQAQHNNSFFKLLLVSRFTPEKNIPFVFEVFQKLPNTIVLTLVGYGVDYEKIQRLAFNILGLSSDRIHFIHKPQEDELIALYRSADLFLFPSQTDTQGLVLSESMSQAVPVIALDGPGQRDIIINGVNGFIISNAEEAAYIIHRIMHDKVLLKHLKEGASQTGKKYFAQRIVSTLEELYDECSIKKPCN